MKAKYLKIEWNDKKTQATARMNGFKYNANLKCDAKFRVFEHTSPEGIEIPEHFSIFPFIVQPKKKSAVDSGYGFMMNDTAANWDLVKRFGYDAIEKVS